MQFGKILYRFLVGITLSLAALSVSAGSVLFVSTDDELNIALEATAKNVSGGVAVRQEFYVGSAKQTKDRVRGLIATVREAGFPTYAYGAVLDPDVNNEMVQVFGRACGPNAFVIGYIEPAFFTCLRPATAAEAASEVAIRLRIVNENEEWMSDLRKFGHIK